MEAFSILLALVRGIHQTKHNINLYIYQKSYCIFMNSYSSFEISFCEDH